MERYFNFKYYLEVGEIIACIVILGFLCLCIVISKLLDRWEKRQNKRSEEYWKEHKDENIQKQSWIFHFWKAVFIFYNGYQSMVFSAFY